jgi:hypothetical protein
MTVEELVQLKVAAFDVEQALSELVGTSAHNIPAWRVVKQLVDVFVTSENLRLRPKRRPDGLPRKRRLIAAACRQIGVSAKSVEHQIQRARRRGGQGHKRAAGPGKGATEPSPSAQGEMPRRPSRSRELWAPLHAYQAARREWYDARRRDYAYTAPMDFGGGARMLANALEESERQLVAAEGVAFAWGAALRARVDHHAQEE